MNLLNTFLKRPLLTALAGAAMLLSMSTVANNIQVTNTTLTGNTGTTVQVQFDVSWENSWRGVGMPNWDAAWVFVKYRNGAGVWGHAMLTATGHVVPAGATLDLGRVDNTSPYNPGSNPYVGGFLYRNANGTGTFSLTGVQLQWNYAALGLAYTDISQVQVFAIEMVYVPQGAFWVGGTGAETYKFTNGTSPNPFQVTSESVTVGGAPGGLWSQTGPPPSGMPLQFPKGFAASYCMKYELSQRGYVDFLNTLTYNQQAARTAFPPTNAPGSEALQSGNQYRNGIDIRVSGVNPSTPAVYACNADGDSNFGEPEDGEDVACNAVSTVDVQAYLDWSGLRPMTELEFEKLCRGPLAPVANEFAWGTAGIKPAPPYTINNINLENEGIATNYSTTLGNAYWNQTVHGNFSFGPSRVGVFAANGSNSGRVTSGGSYYGIMELSGNLVEPVIGTYTGSGAGYWVSYFGFHGNGSLDAGGLANAPTWPNTLAGPSAGMAFRGGSIASPTSLLMIADRSISYNNNGPTRYYDAGCRGVRTAP